MNEAANPQVKQETITPKKEPKYDFRFMMRDQYRDAISQMFDLKPSDAGETAYINRGDFETHNHGRIAPQRREDQGWEKR